MIIFSLLSILFLHNGSCDICTLFFKVTSFSIKLSSRTPQSRNAQLPLFLPFSQVTEHKWEPAKPHLHSNSLHGAQCSRANGQRRGKSCDGYLGDSSETHILHIHPVIIIINIPYLMFHEFHLNVSCIYSQPCEIP